MKHLLLIFLLFATPCFAELTEEELPEIEEFLRKNFQKFPKFPLAVGKKSGSNLHIVKPYTPDLIFKGRRFFAFRFDTPSTVKGSLAWMYLLDKKSADSPGILDYGWQIMEQHSQIKGFTHFLTTKVRAYPRMIERFPFTNDIVYQPYNQDNLKPNKHYLIWFQVSPEQKKIPNIVVALTLAEAPDVDPTMALPFRRPPSEGIPIREIK